MRRVARGRVGALRAGRGGDLGGQSLPAASFAPYGLLHGAVSLVPAVMGGVHVSLSLACCVIV